MELLDTYDCLLLDLDGTVWEGGRAIPDAVETINSASAAGVACVYTTNNAVRPPEKVAEMLRAIGLEAASTDVITSAQAAVRMAQNEQPEARTAYVIGTDAFREIVRAAGIEVVDSADAHPDIVLQGLDPEAGWKELTEAALAIRNGAMFVASNMDTTLPSQRGLAVGNGSMVAAVVSATGVQPKSAGKPEPTMFLEAAKARGAARPLAVGDRLDTDIQGGVAAGMPAFHVLSGVSREFALIGAPKRQRPTYVGATLADLNRDAAELVPGAQGGFVARVKGDDLLLDRGDEEATSSEALRTVLEVAWAMPTPPEAIRPLSAVAERAIQSWS